jgi:hypothetical protein
MKKILAVSLLLLLLLLGGCENERAAFDNTSQGGGEAIVHPVPTFDNMVQTSHTFEYTPPEATLAEWFEFGIIGYDGEIMCGIIFTFEDHAQGGCGNVPLPVNCTYDITNNKYSCPNSVPNMEYVMSIMGDIPRVMTDREMAMVYELYAVHRCSATRVDFSTDPSCV